jgi:uncharacterized protein YndB with AHSA1/START domain
MNARSPINAGVTRRFIASAEQVFDAWLDRRKVLKWLAPGASWIRMWAGGAPGRRSPKLSLHSAAGQVQGKAVLDVEHL